MEEVVSLPSGYGGVLLSLLNELNTQTTRSKAALKIADPSLAIVREPAALNKEANGQIPEARTMNKEIRNTGQDWVAELKTVNSGFAFKQRQIQ